MHSIEDSNDIVIIGAGSYATTIAELAESCGYRVLGYLDDDPTKARAGLDGIPVCGPIDSAMNRLESGCSIAVAIGNNAIRLKWLYAVRAAGHSTPRLISPSALVSPKASVADAVYMHPGSHVWTHAKLGLGTILSPNATVAHHTVLGDGCFVSTGANVGASIAVGECAMFGIGSTVSTGVSCIAPHTLVGAGTVVIRDTIPHGVYGGAPARLLRTGTK